MSSGSPETITCRAVVCWGSGEPLKIEQIQVAPPKFSEVRVKMLYASLCHTDILIQHGFPTLVFPRVMGHEGVGMVESTGDGVEDLKEGDLVIIPYVGECQECDNCTSEKSNLCHKYPILSSGLMLDGTSRLSINGNQLYQILGSTWSEYTVADSGYVVKVDPSMPLSHASFLSCGFTTGLGAPWFTTKVEHGSTVAIFGLGAVGLGAIQGAKIRGASKIIGVDKNGMKFDIGKAYGMTDFINPEDEASAEKTISTLVKDITGGHGVDYCFECTGVPQLLNEALDATKLGQGTTIVVGAGTHDTIEINFLPLLFGRTLRGCIYGGVKIRSHLPLIMDKCIKKEIQLDHLLTHEISLDDIGKAFDLLRTPDCIKVIIKI